MSAPEGKRWRRARASTFEGKRWRRESDRGERGFLRLNGSDGEERGLSSLSESVEGAVLSGPRDSSRKGRFSVELKTFEIEVEEKKGKMQAMIVERKRGISSWIRMGPESLGLFLEGLVHCSKDTSVGKWEGLFYGTR